MTRPAFSWTSLLRTGDEAIRQEAVRLLALHAAPERTVVLAEVAADTSIDAEVRADAVAGLAGAAGDHADLLRQLADDAIRSVAAEAFRTLVSAGINKRKIAGKPPIDDIAAWESLINQATGEADLNVGRRLFFHANLGGCYKCHVMNGRGHHVGPDLTTIRNQSEITRGWLVQHIVDPNREMAPYYRPQQLLTYDGEVLTGLIVGREGSAPGYVNTQGVVFYVQKDDVEERRELTSSIMPTGLLDKLTADEIRDLIAYLLAKEES